MLTIEQAKIALEHIENQMCESECNYDALDLQLRTIRRWSNKVQMDLAIIGNKLRELDNQLSNKAREDNNTT